LQSASPRRDAGPASQARLAAHEQNGAVRALTLTTRAATTESETYSSLIRTTKAFGDVDFTVDLLTRAQLRSPQPKPWEVAWVVWRYTYNQHF